MALGTINFTREGNGSISVGAINYRDQSLDNEYTKKKVQAFISKKCTFQKTPEKIQEKQDNESEPITTTHTITIFSDKVEFSDNEKFIYTLEQDQNKALLDSILKTELVFELSYPTLKLQSSNIKEKKPEENTNIIIQKIKEVGKLLNLGLIKATLLAKFCDVSKDLRWGFFVITYGVLLTFAILLAFHINFLPMHAMSFIPPIYGISIVGGVLSFLLILNLSKIRKNQKIKKDLNTTDAQKKLCEKEIKEAKLNILFSLSLLSLLTIPILMLSPAFHGASISSLSNIGFSNATILFGTFNILVGAFQLWQAGKNFLKAHKNRNINQTSWETIKEFFTGSEWQGTLQMALNVMLITTGIAAFLITNQHSSLLLAGLIESTTFLNIAFVIYNLKKLSNIKKEIKESKDFKSFLERYFKLTKEEEEKVNNEVEKQYQKNKDFRRWATINLLILNLSLKEKNKFLEYEDEKKIEFIKLFYYQKAIDKKRDLFQLLVGTELCDKCTDALKKDINDVNKLKTEVLKAIDKRKKVEVLKFIAPAACLLAFGCIILLSVISHSPAVSLFLNNNIAHNYLWKIFFSHYYLWLLFTYSLLQLGAKAIMTPIAYFRTHRNIPADEESVIKPVSVKDHLLGLLA